MTSASVELRVLIFCFVDRLVGQPFPSVTAAAPVLGLLKSGCTANEASTHQLMIDTEVASRVNGSSRVARKKDEHRPNFFQRPHRALAPWCTGK